MNDTRKPLTLMDEATGMQTVTLPTPGEIFQSRYRVIDQIGEGGFSKVYRAHDLQANDRVVALKILVPATTEAGREPTYGREIADRFLREARVLTGLNHPNTIRMFDHGRTSSGVLYMVFEFVQGKTVYEEIRDNGRMKPQRVVNILRQTLAALHAAHTQGLLHRDIKPNNIMLMATGHGEQVKVLDFGIAKAFGAGSNAPGNDLTAAGTLVGTPRYMPPEQLRGQPMGPGSDLYSLGIVCMEMLTGKKAIAGKDRIDVIHRQLQPQSLTLPPNLQVDTRLRRAVDRLLEKDVQQRYSSAPQVMNDIQALLSGGDDATVQDTVDMKALSTVDMKQRVFRNQPADDATVQETVDMKALKRPGPEHVAETVDMAALKRPTELMDDTIQKTINVDELDAALKARQRPGRRQQQTLASTGWRPSEEPSEPSVSQPPNRPGISDPTPAALSSQPQGGRWDTLAPGSMSDRQSWQQSAAQAGHGTGERQAYAQGYGSGPRQAFGTGERQAMDQQGYGSGPRQAMDQQGYGSGPRPAFGTGERQAIDQQGYGSGPRQAFGTGERQAIGTGEQQAIAAASPNQLSASPDLESSDMIILGASLIVPGLAQYQFGQKKKGIAILAGTILTCGIGYIASIAFVIDAYLVWRTSQKRAVGEWEFFPDFKEATG